MPTIRVTLPDDTERLYEDLTAEEDPETHTLRLWQSDVVKVEFTPEQYARWETVGAPEAKAETDAPVVGGPGHAEPEPGA